MKRIIPVVLTLLMIFCHSAGALSIDDLTPELKELNASARVDLPGFKANLSTTFGVPVPRVEGLIATLGSPADAYFCLRIGQLSGRSIDVVSREFKAHGDKGWGVVAKNLGIKPGSKAFHELKNTAKMKHKEKKYNKGNGNNKNKGKKNK